MEDKKTDRQTGLLYVAINATMFLSLWLWPATKGFADWTISYTWVEPAATAGELTVLFAAVLATIFPKGFLWVFGRLIRRVVEFWRAIRAAQSTDENDISSQVPPPASAARRPHRTAAPAPRQLPPIDWQPWVMMMLVGVMMFGSAPFHDPVRRTEAPTILVPTAQSIDDPANVPKPTLKRPKTVTIAAEGSCEEIAARYCRAEAWPEFTAENSIPVVRRGSRQICIIHQGQTYQLPGQWTDEHCGPLPQSMTP